MNGPLVEVWFDGAGSQGREYDWNRIIGLIDQASGNHLFGTSMERPPSQVNSQYVSSYTNWKYGSGLLNNSFVSAISYLYNLWFIIGLGMIEERRP